MGGSPRQKRRPEAVGDDKRTLTRKPAAAGPPSPIADLQRRIGNRATARVIQARLQVGAVSDPAEREADAVAAQVTARLHQGTDADRDPGELDVGGPSIRRRATAASAGAAGHGPNGGEADVAVEAGIAQARSGGARLAAAVRGPIEHAMGADLGGVRIHTDGRADQLNRSLNAEAFTTGSDIFFRQGAYQPASPAGTELLAHELTHVVQQGGAAQRKIRRSLVRDRVYSHTELETGVTAPDGGSQALAWAHLLDELEELESRHTALASDQAKMAKQDAWSKTLGASERSLKATLKSADGTLSVMPGVIVAAQTFVRQEEEKTAGFGGKVKGLLSKKSTKRSNASRLDRVRTLLVQLQRRREQLRATAEKYRVDLLTMKKRSIEAKAEGKDNKNAAMDEARHGTFGMYKGRVNDASFGAGAMGSVAQVDYKDENGELFKGVFKAEPDRLGDNDGGMKALGTSEDTPNLTMRSVAASRLNELLGMKVIPRTELAFHEQFGFGQVMALAGGRSPKTKVKVEIDDVDEEKIRKIEAVLAKENEGAQVVRKQGGSGQVRTFIEENVTFETDWDHPILKRELANLQLMDGLIGNVDRHCENYFIQVDSFGNPVGVLGIDNDLTFAKYKNDPTEIAWSQGHHAGLPPAIDRYTAEKFCAVTEGQVRGAVKGLLDKQEVDILIVRLKVIQEKLSAQVDGEFVIPRIGSDLEGAKQWTEVKDPKNVKGAYFARERRWQQGPMKEKGRLLKPQHALLYKENRLASLLKRVHDMEHAG